MFRQNLQHSAWGAVLSVVIATVWVGKTVSQDRPAPQPAPAPENAATPASQPASQPTSDASFKRLMELNRQTGQIQQPASSQPTAAPHPSLGQRIPPGGAATTDDDDFVGPPYAPATPPELLPFNGQATRPIERPASKPVAEEPARPETARPEPVKSQPPAGWADGAQEWFRFSAMPWEKVIETFVERIGKPMLGDDTLAIGGELTYISDRKFTKEEAIDELNLIMHTRGYRFVETPNHVMVVPLSEMAWHVDVKQVFASREEFEQADVRPMDFVTAFIHVKDHSAKKIQEMFYPMAGDELTMVADQASNQIKMVGLVQDIRKVLTLMDRISIDEADPRTMRVLAVKTNVRDVERLVRDLLGSSSGPQVQLKPDAQGRMVPTTVAGAEEDFRLVADDRTNTIIVKAVPAKLKEIVELIEQVGEKPDIGEFTSKVIEIKNANAADVEAMLNKIFSTEQGQTPAWQRLRQVQQRPVVPTRGRQQPQQQPQQPVPVAAGVSPEDLLGEGIFERAKKTIRIAADERTNSLIVYANAEGQQRVADLLKTIDQAQPGNFRTIKLEQAQVSQIANTVNQIVQGIGASRGRGASVVPDEINNQFYVIAEREEMQQVEEVVRQLDVPMPEGERHVVELMNLAPSKVAQLIQPLLAAPTGATGGGAVRQPRGGRFPQAGPVSVGPTATSDTQIIPLDEARLLIVICSAQDWIKVEDTIRIWDERAKSNTPLLRTFEIKHGDPQAIATTLNGLYRTGYKHPSLGPSQVLVQAEGPAVLVYAVQPALDEIAPLIDALDCEDGMRLEILPLVYADASQVAQQATQLFGAAIRQRPQGLGGPASNVVIQADAGTNSLLAQADDATLNKIKDFALLLDQKAGAQLPEQKSFVLKFAQPQEVAQAIGTLYGSGARQRGMPVGASVKAVVAGAQLFIEAPHDKLAEIEALIAQFDDPKGNEIVIRPIKIPGADVMQIAAKLNEAFAMKGQKQAGVARFSADAASEMILVTCSKSLETEVDALLKEFEKAYEPVGQQVEFRPLQHAQATEVAPWLSEQLVIATRGQNRNAAQDIKVTADARTNRIIINAPKMVVAMADTLLAQMDVGIEGPGRIQTITLKYAVAGEVSQMLQALLKDKIGKTVQIGVEPDTNTLIVSASPEDFAEIKRLAEDADTRIAAEDSALTPITIAIKYADANQLVQMINAMFGTRGQSKGQQDVQAQVSNGSLVIKAPKKKLEQIRALVAEIDSEDKSGLQIKTYSLKVLNAIQVAAQVQLYLSKFGNAARGGQMQPGAFGEPSTNTLVVIAPVEKLPFIDSLITQLETSDGRLAAEARTYVLKNARADQVVQNIDMMLKAKIAEREGDVRKSRVQTAVFSDAPTNRLFVYAPEEYHALAAQLIQMVDQDVATGDIVHIIQLQQADATALAQTLQQVLPQSAGKGGGSGVRITADSGSNSLLLSGLPKDVAEVERYIGELETKSEVIPELQVFQLKYVSAEDISETLEKLFPGGSRTGGKGGTIDAVTISPDDYYNRLLITANKRKMRQVEAFVEQLDVAPDTGGSGLADAAGRQIYFIDVYRGDPWDIAWNVRDLFPPEDKGGPVIDADLFGEYIKVKCHPNEYDRILSAIREFEKRAKVENKVVVRTLKGDTEQILAYLQQRMGEGEIEVQRTAERPKPRTIVTPLWADDEEPDAVRKQREKDQERQRDHGQPSDSRGSSNGRVRPFELGLPVSVALLNDVDGALFDEPAQPAPRRADPPAPAGAAPKSTPAAPPPRSTAAPVSQPSAAHPAVDPKQPAGAEDAAAPQKDKTRIVVQPDGSVIIYGPEKDVNEVEKAIDLLQEDLAVGEVIRIFEFKYGDVTAAAEVVQIMFNDRQQQMLRMVQPQQPVQPGQQGPQGQRGRGDQKEGDGRDQQGSMMEQLQRLTGARQQQQQQQGRGAAGERVKIATDPGHNYLIIKCQENDLPEIKQLLRELDIPPGKVEVRVFQLKNLDAQETAENIKDVLGINKAQQRRGGGAAGAQGRRTQAGQGINPQQQLMEMLQQQMVSVPGVEGGAKVEQAEIVPNAVTNSLMVSAPPEVMELIERVINELEDLEGRDVVGIYHQELKLARVDDVVPLLQEIFSAVGSGGGAAAAPGRPGRTARSGSPSAIGPVTISGDPRVNTIIFTAETKDVPTVLEQIKRLDIEGAIAEAEMYICKFGDATSIAAAVDAIFVGGGSVGGAARPGRGGSATPALAGQEVRIVAEPATNVIVVWGPPDKRDLILAKIQDLDVLAKRDIREIDVKFADPERLADTLLQIFSASAGGSAASTPQMPSMRGGRFNARGTRSSGTGTGGISITGDKNSKKLLVRAPDPVFTQIEQVVATIDQPNKQMEIKRFALAHADAEFVVEAVKNAMTELTVSTGAGPFGGGESPFDPFTAVADPRTNSVLVVGSQQTFGFVESLLKTVDVETPADQLKDFRVYVLDRADPEMVAQAINDLAAGEASGTSGSGGTRRTGGSSRGGRMGMFGMTTPTPARDLSVTAIADTTTRTVMVYGKPEDIDVVEQLVIDQLEDKIARHMDIATIPVQNVLPSEIMATISQFIVDQESSAPGGASGRGGQRRATGPQVIPNDNAKTLIVRGSKADIDQVRDLVERFDSKDMLASGVKLIPVPVGQDPTELAREVESVVNGGEQILADATGRRARQVAIVANQQARALYINGDQSLYGTVETVVRQLSEIATQRYATRIIELRNLSSDDVEGLINDLQGRGSRSGGSRTGSNPATVRPASTPRSTGGTRPSGGGTNRPGGTRPGGTRPQGGGGSGARPNVDSPWSSLNNTDSTAASLFSGVSSPAYVSVALVSPAVGAAVLKDFVSAAQEPPAAAPVRPRATRPANASPASQPAPSREPATPPETKPVMQAPPPRHQPPATIPVAEPPAPASEEPPAATEPALENIVTGELRGEVIATPIDSRRIVIQGDEADLDFIERVLMMMEQSTPSAVIEVYALQSAKATVLAPIIEKVVKARIDVTTPRPGPSDKFTITAEGRSNSLIASASETIQAQIAELVDKLDVSKPGGQNDIRAVTLVHVRAAEAVAMMRPTLEKLWVLGEVPKESQPSIEALDRNNSILIVGTPKDIETVEQLIQTVDVEVTAGEELSFVAADAIMIQLQNGSADDVAKVLNDMIKAEQDAAAQGGTSGSSGSRTVGKPFVKVIRLRIGDRELPELNLERPIRIVPEKGTNSLIVFSTPKNNEALTEIVKVFDSLPIGADTDVRAIALQYAGAEEVAKLVEDMFKDKAPLQRPGAGEGKSFAKGELPPVPPGLTGKGLPYNLSVQHDVRSNTVVLVGRKDAVLLATGLITQLDKPSLELGLKPHIIELKKITASVFAEKLTKFLDDRSKALGTDKNKARDSAVLSPDDRSGRLIVLATPEIFDMIENLAAELDAAENYRVVDTHFRKLAYADSQKVAGLMKEIYDAKQKADKDQSKDSKDSLAVVADSRSNSVVLTGTRDYLSEAETLIDNLDQKFDPTVVMKVHPIRMNSASNIAVNLKDLVDKALKEQDSKLKGTPIYVAADVITNCLLLAASQEDMTTLDRWVEILDRPSEIDRMTAIIPLKRGSAETVSKAASDLFKNSGSSAGGGKSGIDVSITFDASTNAVVAFGPPAVLSDVADFVRRLDETEAGGGTVVRMFKLVQADAQDAGDLLTNVLQLRSGSVGGGGRSSGGSSASKEVAKQIMLLYQKEDANFGTNWLKAIRSDITVISDLRTNSLVVAAPVESMPLMESLVHAIDVPPAANKVRVFPLRNADAEQMVKMLDELFAQKQSGSSGTRASSSGEGEERTLTLGEGLGGEGGRQEVSFTTDVRTNSVIAAGTPGYLDLVEQLVLELDTKPISDFTTRVYSPRAMVSDDLAKAITDYSDKEKSRLKEMGDEISLAKQQEREIVAISHAESNRIILSYNPRIESDVMNVVRSLDQPPAQVSIEVLIVEVTTGNKLELGVEFAAQDLQYTKAGPADTTTFDYVGGTDVGAAGAGLGGFTFTITGRDFNFLLRTLQSENCLKVLSRPHIVAMDNQEAKIEIVNKVPYVTGTSTTTAGQIQTQVTREDVGIKLSVKPQINPDGYVRMEVTQEVSDLSDSTIAIGQGLTAPIFFTRLAETVVTVQDNETVVLGGLIQSRDAKTEQKIPIIGDIPLLGPLFRYQSDDQKRAELLVILTPRVIRTIEDYRALSQEARDQTGLITDDIKANPLMRALQVKPDEAIPEAGADELQPVDQVTPGPRSAPDAHEEQYGPRRPAGSPERPSNQPAKPDSYDVPVSHLTRRS